jgi:hypothetical protein
MLKLTKTTKYFLLINLLIILTHFLFHNKKILGMDTSLFYLDETITTGSFFSTITLFFTGYFFLQYGDQVKNKGKSFIYSITGLLFLALSLDEYFSIHEYLNFKVKHWIKFDGEFGPLDSTWMVSLSFLILIVISVFIVLIKNETNKFAKYSYLTGLICFIIVLVFEVLGANNFEHLIYIFFTGIEEGLEMIGATFFLNGILLKQNEYNSDKLAKAK